MNVEQAKAFCRSLPATHERLLGEPSNILVYSVGEKNFAWFKTSEPERWRFSFRVTPERFVELTDMPGVRPARYMGRFRWITIVDVHRFPAGYLRELVQWSYAYTVQCLTRRRREALGLADEAGSTAPSSAVVRPRRARAAATAAVCEGPGKHR
ncbi:MmcQ/YjbR family DNA-binding protein [Tahibacter sp.]|uniref:MmcQ/YjbR family DNA-binding protein n=1 Tax=Tahibacter sp. TaxID=2056211 RepID=UPI0028C40E3E|nr:MmcQ/YjbR family DNA-binding protein [Tahibacter sp.]